MLKIVVVDDDIEELNRTEKLVHGYCRKIGARDVYPETFSDPMVLRKLLACGKTADVYILDIVMPGINGIALGEIIREKDPKASIIYLTTSAEYAVESYSVRAADYCIKPCTEERLYNALDRVIPIVRKEKDDRFVVNVSDGYYAVPMTKIVYAEYYEHRLILHLSDGKTVESVSQRGAFSRLCEPLLKNGSFIRISASYVINMAHVSKLRANEFVLDIGQSMPISRTYQDSRGIYMDYLLK